MKKWVINKYYDMLIWLEDAFGSIECAINSHRGKIDKKYWEKYLNPQ